MQPKRDGQRRNGRTNERGEERSNLCPVSTAEQETALQEIELEEYCERRGWSFVLYRDKGQSGAKQGRPALNSLLSDLRRRQFDVLVVWALDRLARSLKQLLAISEDYRSLGVDLLSLKQAVDTTLPAGRLTFQVLGAVGRVRARDARRASSIWNGAGTEGREECGPTRQA
jgi:DNA invertase Pin-like site-specific DNA recombinase